MNKINIRPTTGVYATYKNLRYEPWTAIAEFVDNSTQSFFDHEKELCDLPNFDKLNVNIMYSQDEDGEDYLEIYDNAYGMELNNFERAIVLDKPPVEHNDNSRNEFGMGLKTAACWFGRLWTVKSKQLGSKYVYTATIDIDKLSKDKDEEIDLIVSEDDINEHYTIITIKKLNKKINGPRTIGKVTSLLASIYRQDIRRGKVSIKFRDKELTYKDPEIYEDKFPDGSIKKWKEEIDFSIEHMGKLLNVKGFIALRTPGSHSEAGFTLLRRGRVIIGGPDCNYRPNELFGDSGSYAYQRMYGELNMDNWPVTQAKDNFDWHNDGLEEKFIDKMKEYTKSFKSKAEKIRTRTKLDTGNTLDSVCKDLAQTGVFKNFTIEKVLDNENQFKNKIINSPKNEINQKNNIETVDVDESITGDCGVIIDGAHTQKVSFTYKGNDYTFTIIFDDSNQRNLWLTVQPDSNPYEITLKINMKHQFFYPLIDDAKFIKIITKFIIAMVMSEIETQNESPDGRVDVSDIRINMNKLLEVIQYESEAEKNE